MSAARHFLPPASELIAGKTRDETGIRSRQSAVAQTGGPEVLEYKGFDLAPPRPRPGAGAPYRHRRQFHRHLSSAGLYQMPLPSGLGSEAAGVAEVLGAACCRLQRSATGSAYDGGAMRLLCAKPPMCRPTKLVRLVGRHQRGDRRRRAAQGHRRAGNICFGAPTRSRECRARRSLISMPPRAASA